METSNSCLLIVNVNSACTDWLDNVHGRKYIFFLLQIFPTTLSTHGMCVCVVQCILWPGVCLSVISCSSTKTAEWLELGFGAEVTLDFHILSHTETRVPPEIRTLPYLKLCPKLWTSPIFCSFAAARRSLVAVLATKFDRRSFVTLDVHLCWQQISRDAQRRAVCLPRGLYNVLLFFSSYLSFIFNGLHQIFRIGSHWCRWSIRHSFNVAITTIFGVESAKLAFPAFVQCWVHWRFTTDWRIANNVYGRVKPAMIHPSTSGDAIN